MWGKDAHNQEDEDNIMGQYVIFCKVYDEQRKKYGQTKKAILGTIRICKDRNILKEYLKEKELEVIDIMATLFSQEDVLEAYVEEVAQERENKKEKETEKKTAARMIQDGEMSLEKIARYVPSLSINELKKLAAEIAPAN